MVGLISNLAVSEPSAFQTPCKLALSQVSMHSQVATYFRDHWADCAEHWAALGRTAVAHLRCDTNNFLERINLTIKPHFPRGALQDIHTHAGGRAVFAAAAGGSGGAVNDDALAAGAAALDAAL